MKNNSTNNKGHQHSQSNTRCPICSVFSLCLSSGLDDKQFEKLYAVIEASKTIDKNQKIFGINDVFDSIYIVNSGIFKSTTINQLGKVRVTSFHLPGELFGFDGIHSGSYQTTVTALSMSSYYKIQYNNLLELFREVPAVNNNLIKIMSREIYSCKANHMDLPSHAKLSQFIKNISSRFESRGYLGSQFMLPISQRDIANFLGMAEETLSRSFKKLQTQKVIEFNKHVLTIVNQEMLEKLSDP